MTKEIKIIIITILTIIIFITTGLKAQDKTAESETTFSIEMDPLVPIVLHGIGGHFIWTPKNSTHFVFGAAIIVSGTMPQFLINLDPKNKDQGWHYKINQGFGIEGEYYFEEANHKWFTGVQLFTEEINLTNDNVPMVTEHRTNIGRIVLTAGYKWYPFKNENFYLKPWMGIGYTSIINAAFSSEVISNTRVGNYEYHIQPITPFATIHIGYTF
jgi:hypothetical protein